MGMSRTVRPEPVEGLSFPDPPEGEGSDKLSPNGFSYPESCR
jgi:hypothetical protein